jgi:hypothetical protein
LHLQCVWSSTDKWARVEVGGFGQRLSLGRWMRAVAQAAAICGRDGPWAQSVVGSLSEGHSFDLVLGRSWRLGRSGPPSEWDTP